MPFFNVVLCFSPKHLAPKGQVVLWASPKHLDLYSKEDFFLQISFALQSRLATLQIGDLYLLAALWALPKAEGKKEDLLEA